MNIKVRELEDGRFRVILGCRFSATVTRDEATILATDPDAAAEFLQRNSD